MEEPLIKSRIKMAKCLIVIGAVAPTIAIAEDRTKPPKWKVDEAVVPLTGAKSINAVRESTNTISNMIGNPDHAALFLRCSDNVLAAYVAWPQVLQTSMSTFGGTPQTMVLWKLDQGQIDVNFQRWCSYAINGHGGNVRLRSRDPSDYQISILEVAGSLARDIDVLNLEELWKSKLQSREMGLNAN